MPVNDIQFVGCRFVCREGIQMSKKNGLIVTILATAAVIEIAILARDAVNVHVEPVRRRPVGAELRLRE